MIGTSYADPLPELRLTVRATETSVYALRGEVTALRKRLQSLQEQKATLEADESLNRKVSQFLEKCSELTKQDIKDKVETLVTWALQSILQTDEYRFKVEFLNRRNQIECDFYIQDRKGQQLNLLEACGGGLVDIVSMALRIVLTELLKVKGPLVLDEPYRMVSSHYITHASEFLKQVSEKLNRQMIIVTHNQSLAQCADKLFEVKLENGESRVKEVV